MAYGIFGWILVGLVAGALARWLHPGPDPGGLFTTIAVGIAGGVIGGSVGRWIGLGPGSDLWNLVLATGGALGLLILYRLVRQGR